MSSIKFFKPEDFKCSYEFRSGYPIQMNKFETIGGLSAEQAAEQANAKLERESRIVIGSPETNWDEAGNKIETHKALLINIEPIEKCKHNVDDLVYSIQDKTGTNIMCYACKTKFRLVEM
jgi:hypothetical protein